MKSFNLTEWALTHKQLVYYFIAVIFLTGIFSYKNLGRMEDPDFTIRQMVVAVNWPGASARQVQEQVTDKLERKLQDLSGLDYVKSYSRPGQSIIFVALKDDAVTESEVRPKWLEVRNMLNDIKPTLPVGVYGPYFNDRFDDVFGCIYALTGDGYSYEDLRTQAENIRRTLLTVPSVKKIELYGVQSEKIYIEIETGKLAQLGLFPPDIIGAVQAQNAMTPSGMFETSTDNVYLRISGMFENLEDLKSVPIRAGGNTIRLGDIAKIERSYSEPADPMMFYNGKPTVGIMLSMEKGGNILTLGENLDKTLSKVKKELPVGLELNTVSNQPKMVEFSINEFVESLAEAIAIVLIVCFISLGFRSGFIVSLCIPLVIAGVFITMKALGIDLHKISLGALIIALGLLVDDAIITIEMIVVKMEQGWTKFDAACYAFTATAYPRLTGALVTCAGFIPVGFSKGSASEFVGSIFSVVTISLLISWVVAGMGTPLFGYQLLKVAHHGEGLEHDIYDTKFYRWFKQFLSWCLNYRKTVIILTVACFCGAVFLLGHVKQEFFPASTRPELIVELQLPEGASLAASQQVAARFSQQFSDDKELESYTYYVGQGAPRFVLTAEPAFNNSNFVQFVFTAKDLNARKVLDNKVHELLATEFTDVRANSKVIKLGPSDPYPVMLRLSGNDIDKVRTIATQMMDVIATNPKLKDVHMDWNEKSKSVHLVIDQDKARVMGVSSQTLAQTLQALVSGAPIGEFHEKDRTVSILLRLDDASRQDLSRLKDINIPVGNGKYVPLDQIAKVSYEAEEDLIWRRDLKPTITLQANTIEGVLGNDATYDAFKQLKEMRDKLPAGYELKVGGTAELSEKSMIFLLQPVPVMVIVIMTLLMFQLQNISKMIITLLTAPLGIIGVSVSLFLTDRPMGFVVQLGILALAGIIMRNSVILIDQIEQQIAAGESLWNAILNATVARFRPIMLTATAAILAMIPLVSSVFWGPMAVAIAGGLFGATILTLIVLPVMYAAWYKATPETSMQNLEGNAHETM